MRFSIAAAVAVAAFLLPCSAAPVSSKHVLHEKRDGKLHQWEKLDRAATHHTLPIRIGLRQQNLEYADSYIYDVADPSSTNFGESAPKSLSRSWILDFIVSTITLGITQVFTEWRRSNLDCRIFAKQPWANRQALVGTKGRKHLCSASRDQEHRNGLASGVWYPAFSAFPVNR